MEAAGSAGLPRTEIYPERTVARLHALDYRVLAAQSWWIHAGSKRKVRALSGAVARTVQMARAAARMDDAALQRAAREIAPVLRRTGCFDPEAVPRCFSLVREASQRILGMRHYEVQVMGALALLQGNIAEMETGEGKTLTATLAAGAAALAGWPVHVVTVNDYLVERDAEQMRPLYEFFGLSVGTVRSGQTPEQRRTAYACNVTYCSNKELAFDYLRDKIERGQRSSNLQMKMDTLTGIGHQAPRCLLPGLHFAIVDEADSVLIDEARTPLVISSQAGQSRDAERYRQALDLAEKLKAGRDFRIHTRERTIRLTESGLTRIERRAARLGGMWDGKVLREELVTKALTAQHLYHPDEHYLLREGKIQIIDEYTGRVMPDRFWGEGLHQMIEVKEGCEVTGTRVTLAQMTYQRFFRRYKRLAGMSGTCSEVARELWQTYRLAVLCIPTHRPLQRIARTDRVYLTQKDKWQAIVKEVTALHRRGVPVLLGTRSVAASEMAAACLSDAGLPFAVLNAAQDIEEAEIIARAGDRFRITVATNMAGRGTDIKVSEEVEALGGLHVIMSERHDAQRIDRQLAGRTARQGQAGCFQSILSLEDPLMDMDPLGLLARPARGIMAHGGDWVGRLVLRVLQRRAERLHARMRRKLQQQDERLGDALAFAGKRE